MFGRGWHDAMGTLVEWRPLAQAGREALYVGHYELIVDVDGDADRAAFRAHFEQTIRNGLVTFRTGQRLAVRVRGSDVELDEKRLADAAEDAQHREDARMAALAEAPVGTPIPPSPASAAGEAAAASAERFAASAQRFAESSRRFAESSAATRETIEAIARARAIGDDDEVARLKAALLAGGESAEP